MPVTHEPWLVALSLVVAIQGAYVGLTLALQVADAVGLRRRLLLAAAAVSLAVGIWAMHFVAMLAARLPLPLDYLVFPTLLSFLVCVIVVGAAVFAVSAGPLTPARLAAAAAFSGIGIASMHYTGMSALHASAHLHHDARFVAASVAIAIGASGLALWLADRRGRRPPLLISAVAFGTAIAGMHYTAMAGLTVFPHAAPMSGAPALSTDLLAIVVAIVAFLMSAVFLLLLVPDRSAGAVTEAIAVSPAVGSVQAASAPAMNGASAAAEPTAPRTRRLPVERDGSTHFIPMEDVVAVHANAHYTYIFDGSAKFFCPLAISDVEARLDRARFMRVHRSHIVNIDRVVGLKRAGDNGVIELADRYTVPVSRSRFGGLRSRLGVGSRAAVS
ncbi:MAG TPA: MHYT domain-containing protein [Xanthobacteraceae bacterium]|nr:MHYT domain-containing protein [Xanthobacteraceae bacterium]